VLPKFYKENHLLLTYYLRHVGPVKGEIIIPQQKFFYVRLIPGQRGLDGLVAEDPAESEAIYLRYDSTLTEDANDIKDRIYFGSYLAQSRWWSWTPIGILVIGILSAFATLFRGASITVQSQRESKTALAVPHPSPLSVNPFTQFTRGMKKAYQMKGELIGAVALEKQLYNVVRQFLLSYHGEFKPSDTNVEMRKKTLSIAPRRKREIIESLIAKISTYEEIVDAHVRSGASLQPTTKEMLDIQKSVSRLHRRWIVYYLAQDKCRHLRSYVRYIMQWSKSRFHGFFMRIR
jgi:hypothetical protein